MTIYRAPRPDSGFTIIRNEVVRDNRLSLKARGLLLLILSRPDNWTTTAEQLATENKEGRTAILSAFKELRQVGYLRQVRERDSQGRVRTITSVFDYPESENLTPVPTREDAVLPLVAPETGFPESDDPTPYRSTDQEEPKNYSFEAFWFMYPKKVNKDAARRRWETAVKRTHSEDIVDGLSRYVDWINRTRQPRQYVKGPDVWLNKGCWTDELEGEQASDERGWWEAP